MKKFEIHAGLVGSFGGARFKCEEEFENEEQANRFAYEGDHGLESRETIAEENPDWTEQEIEEEYKDERERWIDYNVIEIL